MIHPFLFYLFLPFPDNVVQQSLAGIFEKRDDELEVAIVAIIRIGNGGVFTMMGQEIGHAHNFLPIRLRRSHGGNGTVVFVVHYHDSFETGEV